MKPQRKTTVLLHCGHPKGSASPCAANVYCSSPVTSTRCFHPFRCRHQVKRRCTKSCPAPIYPRYATMLLSAILISPRYPILSDRTRFARCQQHSPDAICYPIRLLLIIANRPFFPKLAPRPLRRVRPQNQYRSTTRYLKFLTTHCEPITF